MIQQHLDTEKSNDPWSEFYKYVPQSRFLAVLLILTAIVVLISDVWCPACTVTSSVAPAVVSTSAPTPSAASTPVIPGPIAASPGHAAASQSEVSPRAVTTSIPMPSELLYTFNVAGVLNETASPATSPSNYWWLDSGGRLTVGNDVGGTMQGDAPVDDPWRISYAENNPVDTDGGLHPQNLFRIVSKSAWNNVRMQAGFYIDEDDFSDSPNRNASNGLLLMTRYADRGQTLYYAGVRVDGTAVIKKKYHGTYYMMDQTTLYPGTYRGDRDQANLIPHRTWIDLRCDTATNPDGSVTVSLYRKVPGGSGGDMWDLLAHSTDHGQFGGTPPITGALPVGIRTDFMDVHFRAIDIRSL